MCGVVGINSFEPVNQIIFDALTALQHRGQDAAGIATYDNTGKLHQCKGNGLVRDVIGTAEMLELVGNMGIGHVRYPTAGSYLDTEAQPFYVNSPHGISLAHNGNLTNAENLAKELHYRDRRHLNTDSDSEILLNVFANALQNAASIDLSPEDVFEAVTQVHYRCRGAYAVVAMIAGHGIVAFRDPYGIRPLSYGRREVGDQYEYMVASERVVLDVMGFEFISDVLPGQGIYITTQGECYTHQCVIPRSYSPCIFEYVYLARPDSVIDKILVYKVRLKLGESLARKIQTYYPDHNIDVVIPVPETSRTAGSVVARELGVKFREGLVKNRYIGRTFIMPGQKKRRQSVRQKLNPIELEFAGKQVLLVDDSIVRGTTAKEIIQMARDAGAEKVFFASASPQVRYPNVYGIDMPSTEELISHGRTPEEVCEMIGADGLVFLDFEDLIAAARVGNPAISRFEDSIFTGDYITGDISAEYLQKIRTRHIKVHSKPSQ